LPNYPKEYTSLIDILSD